MRERQVTGSWAAFERYQQELGLTDGEMSKACGYSAGWLAQVKTTNKKNSTAVVPMTALIAAECLRRRMGDGVVGLPAVINQYKYMLLKIKDGDALAWLEMTIERMAGIELAWKE